MYAKVEPKVKYIYDSYGDRIGKMESAFVDETPACKMLEIVIDEHTVLSISVSALPDDKHEWFREVIESQMMKCWELARKAECEKIGATLKAALDYPMRGLVE